MSFDLHIKEFPVLSGLLAESRHRMEQEDRIKIDNDSKSLKPTPIPLLGLIGSPKIDVPEIPQISMQKIRELERQNAMEKARDSSDSDNDEPNRYDSHCPLPETGYWEQVEHFHSTPN